MLDDILRMVDRIQAKAKPRPEIVETEFLSTIGPFIVPACEELGSPLTVFIPRGGVPAFLRSIEDLGLPPITFMEHVVPTASLFEIRALRDVDQ